MKAEFLLLGVCMLCEPLHATTAPPIEISARAKGADRIVTATVADVRASFGTTEFGDRVIVSHVYLRIEETMKGAPQDAVWLDVEGGTVGDLTLDVSDMPKLHVGTRAVFFLRLTSAGAFVPHLRGLGIVELDAADRVPGTSLTLPTIRRMVAAR